MQLVLNDQVRWIKRPTIIKRPTVAAGLSGTIESKPLGKPIDVTEERAGFPDPRQTCKLVYCGNQEGRQAAIDWLVDGEDRQRTVAGEIAGRIGAADFQIRRRRIVGNASEGSGRERGSAPRTSLDRSRCSFIAPSD